MCLERSERNGYKDENVFDIRPGVAISIFIKNREPKEKKVFYFDLWGLRGDIDELGTKYNFLDKNDFKSTEWQAINPVKPYYFFVPKSGKGEDKYNKFLKVTDIFPINSVGIVTARDRFVIDFDREFLGSRIRNFRDSRKDDEFIKQSYSLKDKPTFRWYIKEARRKLRELENWEDYFVKILYRPFDERWIYYHGSVIERARENVMRHMLQPNLALLTHKREELQIPYTHFLVTDRISEHGCLSGKTTNYQFPLYLYDNKVNQQTIFEGQEELDIKGTQRNLDYKLKRGGRKLNINPKLLDTFENVFGKAPSPEEIFYYIYGVLYSNVYRQRYEEFLKIDFPKIPFTKDYRLFQKVADLGKQLVKLHLLKSPELNNPIPRFYGEGNNLVKVRIYNKKDKKIYINNTQYFDSIEKEVWEYMIGGYQVLDKWLKDRKDKYLTAEEIKHYCRIVTSLKGTVKVQKEVDKFYPRIEKDLID